MKSNDQVYLERRVQIEDLDITYGKFFSTTAVLNYIDSLRYEYLKDQGIGHLKSQVKNVVLNVETYPKIHDNIIFSMYVNHTSAECIEFIYTATDDTKKQKFLDAKVTMFI